MTTILNLLGYLTLAGLTEISLIKMLLMLNCILTKKFITLYRVTMMLFFFFFFQAEDGIRDYKVTGFRRVLFRSVTDCAGVVGETTAFGAPLPVAGLAVDQQAALLAERCFAAGEAKCTYGTGAFLLAATGPRPVRSTAGLSASVAWRLGGSASYCLDGQVYTAGAAVRWLSGLGLVPAADGLDAEAASVPDSGGAVFVPALAGLGAPHWRPDARGAFLGLGL